MGWRERPKVYDYWPSNIDYTLYIDENGDSTLKHIQKMITCPEKINFNDKYFTITGCIIMKDDFLRIRDNITYLKKSYWEDGKFLYKEKGSERLKRVCFHSNEIRGQKGSFSKNIINYEPFIIELSNFMRDLPITILSSTLDKYRHCVKYSNPLHPYKLCLEFILERFVKYYLEGNKTGCIVLEARGKKEDMDILEHIKHIIDHGTNYVSSNYFSKIISVYFNPKWCKSYNDQLSFFGLEIADLCSYPIHKYCKLNKKDPAFETIEDKIYCYPDYFGKGIKIFP